MTRPNAKRISKKISPVASDLFDQALPQIFAIANLTLETLKEAPRVPRDDMLTNLRQLFEVSTSVGVEVLEPADRVRRNEALTETALAFIDANLDGAIHTATLCLACTAWLLTPQLELENRGISVEDVLTSNDLTATEKRDSLLSEARLRPALELFLKLWIRSMDLPLLKPGRIPGSDPERTLREIENARTKIRTALERIEQQGYKSPKQVTVAVESGVTERSVRNQLRKSGLAWDDLKANAEGKKQSQREKVEKMRKK